MGRLLHFKYAEETNSVTESDKVSEEELPPPPPPWVFWTVFISVLMPELATIMICISCLYVVCVVVGESLPQNRVDFNDKNQQQFETSQTAPAAAVFEEEESFAQAAEISKVTEINKTGTDFRSTYNENSVYVVNKRRRSSITKPQPQKELSEKSHHGSWKGAGSAVGATIRIDLTVKSDILSVVVYSFSTFTVSNVPFTYNNNTGVICCSSKLMEGLQGTVVDTVSLTYNKSTDTIDMDIAIAVPLPFTTLKKVVSAICRRID